MKLNALIQDCLQNDRKAQFALYGQFVDYISNVCQRYSHDLPTTQDNVQTTFIKIFKKLNSFDSGRGEFKFWIRRIAINECLATHRKNRRTILIEEATEIPEAIELPNYDAIMDNEKLLEVVNELPSGYKTVFLLYAVDGFKHQEISEQLSISENTSRTQLFKARKMLMKKLEHWNTLKVV